MDGYSFQKAKPYDKIIDAITGFRIASTQLLQLITTTNASLAKLLAVCEGVKRDDDAHLRETREAIRRIRKDSEYSENLEKKIITKFNRRFDGMDVVIKNLTAQMYILKDRFLKDTVSKYIEPIRGVNENIFKMIDKLIHANSPDWKQYYGEEAGKTWIDSSDEEEYFEVKYDKIDAASVPKQPEEQAEQPSVGNQGQPQAVEISKFVKSDLGKTQLIDNPQETAKDQQGNLKKHVDINSKPLENQMLAGEGVFKYTLDGFEMCPLTKSNLSDLELGGLERFQCLFMDTVISNRV